MAGYTYKRPLHEKRALETKRKQEYREDIMKAIQKDTLLMSTLGSDIRVDHKRRVRKLEIDQIEQETFESLIRDHELKIEQARVLKEEEETALEINREAAEMQRHIKIRQSIHENSPELRELEKKLNAAYTNKERQIQLDEQRLSKEIVKLQDSRLNLEMKAANEKGKIQDKLQQVETAEKQHQYSVALGNQLQELEHRKKEEHLVFLKEKELIDEVVRKINEENRANAEMHMQKAKETKEYILDFMEKRKDWKKQEKEAMALENQRILEYAQHQREREQQKEYEKKKIQSEKNAIYDKLAAKQSEQDRAKLELESLRNDLAQEEQEAAAARHDKELIKSRIQKRLELIAAYQNQVAYKAEQDEKEQALEQIYRDQVYLTKPAHG